MAPPVVSSAPFNREFAGHELAGDWRAAAFSSKLEVGTLAGPVFSIGTRKALGMHRKIAWLSLLGITAAVIAGAFLTDRFRARPQAPKPPAPPAERETWDVYRIRGVRAGYGRTLVRHDIEDGRPVIRIEGLIRMNAERFGRMASVDATFADTETPEGVLLSYDCKIGQGLAFMRSVGRVRGDQLEVQMTTQGHRRTESLHWSADYAGMWGPEGSLLRRPMKPGEHRVVHYVSLENQLVATDLTARQEEDVALLDGKYRLLRIDTVEQLSAGQTVAGAAWTTPTGEILKWWREPLDMEAFRVPKEVAMAATPLGKLDLGEDTLVRLKTPLPHGHDTLRARYRAWLKVGSPATAFVSGPAQQVKWIDAHTAEVTVYAIRPGRHDGNPDAPDDPPTDADTEANNFIQSDDPKIVADARKVVPDETNPWQVAVALERYVHKQITHKDLAQAFLTAAEVAATREGDCKAHAFYLAALARARGIPARVAGGLVYMPAAQAFAYHMWTEVYIQKRWLPLDGTLAKGGIGAGHLQLGHSNMAGVSAYGSFLPVIQVIGQLKLELVDTE